MTLASKRKLLGGGRAPLAVTGMGLVSPAGAGVGALEQALRERRSGIVSLESLGAAAERGGLAVHASGVGPHAGGAAATLLAAKALEEAVTSVRLDRGRIGLYVGTALGDLAAGAGSTDPDYSGLGERLAASLARAAPAVRLAALRVFSVTCVSSLCALEQAAADLALDRVDAALVGGVDALSRVMQAGFKALGALSPSGCLKPFACDHDGILLGEAGAFLIVEPLAEAEARGIEPAACVVSQALLSDARHLTSPDPDGAGMAAAIQRALEAADLGAEELGGIAVTAVGSAVYDRMLSRAVHTALGAAAAAVPVSTWEAATGHLLASTGAVSYIFAARAVRDGRLPALAQPVALDPECRLNYAFAGPAVLKHRSVLALTVGFGGQNGAALVMSPPAAGALPRERKGELTT